MQPNVLISIQTHSGSQWSKWPRATARGWFVGQVLHATNLSLAITCDSAEHSQPHWIGGRGNDWRMLLQADYSAAFRMDAVHRGRQINESVMDDVAAGMLGAFA